MIDIGRRVGVPARRDPDLHFPVEVADTMKRSRSSRLTTIHLVLAIAMVACAPARAQEPWHYVLDEKHPARQANFCTTEDEVRDIVSIFERFGPRTGYSALAGTERCFIAVRSFTPTRIVDEIVISEGEPGEYRMRFVEGHDENGEILFLVTTREVKPE